MLDLLRFCANERHYRPHLCKPFELEGYVYATNGHIMVRVPAADYPGHVPYESGLHPKNVVKLVSDAIDAEGKYIAMPGVPEPEKCTRCVGSGIDPDDEEDGPEDCWDCVGSGYARGITTIGGTTFATHYVWRMQQLPGATIKPRGMGNAAAINFDGGAALLMPCKP